MNKQQMISELKLLGVEPDETATNAVLLSQLVEAKKNPVASAPQGVTTTLSPVTSGGEGGIVNLPPADIKPPEAPQVKMIQITEDAWNQVQEKLKMLTEVADKGRVFNYESSQPKKKQIKVKVSIYQGGYIVRWKTNADELVYHPTTGKVVGEKQEYILAVLDKEGKEKEYIVNDYKRFSDARYNEREEADVIGKKEDWNGQLTYDIKLRDGRVIQIEGRFIN